MKGLSALTLFVLLGCGSGARALSIQVDYSFDESNFFSAAGNPQGAIGAAQARAALDAAAARWGAIIDQPLGAVDMTDDTNDPRIRFFHPGTGNIWQISSADGRSTDSLVQEGGKAAANEYRGAWSIPADTWILYAGAHDLSPAAGFGGTEIGTNWNEVINDPDGVNNRGFNLQASPGAPSLPVWGGWVAFNNHPATVWHFDHTTPPPVGKTDLYTIALHEIGHALGLHTGLWHDWLTNTTGRSFTGANSLVAYNADNGTNSSSLTLDNVDHWANDQFLSKIFPTGSPNYSGTVGAGVLQGLLMESRLPEGTRFEITNVDVGALRDLGWSVISGEIQEPTTAENLRIERATDGSIQLSWTSVPGTSYIVQTGTDLSDWNNRPPVTATSSTTVWRDTTPPSEGRNYYRIVSN